MLLDKKYDMYNYEQLGGVSMAPHCGAGSLCFSPLLLSLSLPVRLSLWPWFIYPLRVGVVFASLVDGWRIEQLPVRNFRLNLVVYYGPSAGNSAGWQKRNTIESDTSPTQTDGNHVCSVWGLWRSAIRKRQHDFTLHTAYLPQLADWHLWRVTHLKYHRLSRCCCT